MSTWRLLVYYKRKHQRFKTLFVFSPLVLASFAVRSDGRTFNKKGLPKKSSALLDSTLAIEALCVMVWYSSDYYAFHAHGLFVRCFLRLIFQGFSAVFIAMQQTTLKLTSRQGRCCLLQQQSHLFIFRMRLFSKSISIALLMSSNSSSSSSNNNNKSNISLPHATALAAAAPQGDAADNGNQESETSSSAAAESSIPQLPASTGNDPTIPSIKLGETIRFEEFGPIILNTDGTTRRIANWDTLTKQEQAATWRRISKRNEERRLVLLEQQQQQQQMKQPQADETGEENHKEQEL